MKKKSPKMTKAAEISKRGAAGMAAMTRGRARTFEKDLKAPPPARKQIEDELRDRADER